MARKRRWFRRGSSLERGDVFCIRKPSEDALRFAESESHTLRSHLWDPTSQSLVNLLQRYFELRTQSLWHCCSVCGTACTDCDGAHCQRPLPGLCKPLFEKIPILPASSPSQDSMPHEKDTTETSAVVSSANAHPSQSEIALCEHSKAQTFPACITERNQARADFYFGLQSTIQSSC